MELENKNSSEEIWKILNNKIELFQRQSQTIENLEREINACKTQEKLANETVETLQKTLNTFASNAERSDTFRQKLEERHEHEKKNVSNNNLLNNFKCKFFLKMQNFNCFL